METQQTHQTQSTLEFQSVLESQSVLEIEKSIIYIENAITILKREMSNCEVYVENLKNNLIALENTQAENYIKLKKHLKENHYVSFLDKTDIHILNEILSYFSFVTGNLTPSVYCNRMGIDLNNSSISKANYNQYIGKRGMIRMVIKNFIGKKIAVLHYEVKEDDTMLTLLRMYREMLISQSIDQHLLEELDSSRGERGGSPHFLKIDWYRGLTLFI